jgi:hypothetical protein
MFQLVSTEILIERISVVYNYCNSLPYLHYSQMLYIMTKKTVRIKVKVPILQADL